MAHEAMMIFALVDRGHFTDHSACYELCYTVTLYLILYQLNILIFRQIWHLYHEYLCHQSMLQAAQGTQSLKQAYLKDCL